MISYIFITTKFHFEQYLIIYKQNQNNSLQTKKTIRCNTLHYCFSFVNNHFSLVTSIRYQLIFESLQDHKRRPNCCLPCKSSGSFRFRRKYFLACRIIPQTCGIDQAIFSHFRFNKIRICIKNAIRFVMEENMLK